LEVKAIYFSLAAKEEQKVHKERSFIMLSMA
jgi:hypothetical protein